MTTPRLLNSDYFSQWFTKINSIAQELDSSNAKTGDLTQITLDSQYITSVVSAINRVISLIGTLSSLSTTVKTSIVFAINELHTKIGSLSLLTTTSKDSCVDAINEINSRQIQGTPSITIGTESSNTIRATIQLKNKQGTNLSQRATVRYYISTQSNGSDLSVTPSGGLASGSNGFIIPSSSVSGIAVSNDSGIVNIDITETTAKTFYLSIINNQGDIQISTAITFT